MEEKEQEEQKEQEARKQEKGAFSWISLLLNCLVREVLHQIFIYTHYQKEQMIPVQN